MLQSLSIRDFVIVASLEIEFQQGFTVFSGETGAGKSILIDALALALGERADASVVREGASRADVVANFASSDATRAWLAEQSIDEEGEIIMRRTVDATGRSKGWINGVAVALGQMRALGELLVDIHGQHAHQSLLRPAAQRELLDSEAGLGEMARQLALGFANWQSLAKKRARFEGDRKQLEQEREHLARQLAELDRLAVAHGEWDEIQLEHSRLAHAASLIEGTQRALDTLSESDEALLVRLAATVHRIEQLAAVDSSLAAVVETLEPARIQIQEAVYTLNDYLGRLELDPQRLTEVEARLEAIHGAARRLQVTPDELPLIHAQTRERLDALTLSTDMNALVAEEAAARRDFEAAAAQLSAARKSAAERLGEAVSAGMQTLSMSGGRFEVVLNPCDPSSHGNEDVEFLVAAHAHGIARPLAKVASGGELSRISLAIAVIAAHASSVPTLIFDEVDSGIGGAVAEVVGRLLRRLGRMRQVLCVTHLPQVAAQGDEHFAVNKVSDGEHTLSEVTRLGASTRIDELARMLGGIDITATTRKHARELLAAVD